MTRLIGACKWTTEWRRCPDRSHSGGEVFKRRDGVIILLMMTSARRQLAVPHHPQLPAKCLLADADGELVPHLLRKVDQLPAYDAARCRDRATLDDLRQGATLRVVEQRHASGWHRVDQTVMPGGVES